MNEPWFNPMYAWLPGTLLGVSCGVFGGLAGALIPRGKGRSFLMPVYWVMLTGSAVLLAAGIAAWILKQPYGIWYGLGLAGFIGVTVLGANYYTLVVGYRQAEQRRMQAENLA